MSEQNLHRCIRNNKIQAADLEKIAIQLGVEMRVFFENPEPGVHVVASNHSQAVGIGSINPPSSDSEMERLSDKVRHLEEMLEEKERLIGVLMDKK